MTAPRAVAAAIKAVSGRVFCLDDCFAFVDVDYDPATDRIVIKHPWVMCTCVDNPLGPPATALALHVLDEIARYVATADYGEPLPSHEVVSA